MISLKESKSEKKIFFFGGGEGKGGLASIMHLFYKDSKLKKK